MALSQKHSNQDSVYESFSDLLLGITVLLIALVAILAINVSLKSDRAIKAAIYNNRYTGGVEQPRLYLAAYQYNYAAPAHEQAVRARAIYGTTPLAIMLLESPSRAMAVTSYDAQGRAVAADKGSFGGQAALELIDFLEMAQGIRPDSFTSQGARVPVLRPVFGQKTLEIARTGSRITPDKNLALRALSTAWPSFRNYEDRGRSHTEYRDAVLYVYFESETDARGRRLIWIGDKCFELPQARRSGELDFLVGFSSSNTQFVYLGDYSMTDAASNKRVRWFRDHNFNDAADAYEQYHFTEWSSAHDGILPNVAALHSDLDVAGHKRLTRQALHYRALGQALAARTTPSASAVPPLLRHEQAWQAYLLEHADQNSEVPRWVFDDFLAPLGFDKRVPQPVDGNTDSATTTAEPKNNANQETVTIR